MTALPGFQPVIDQARKLAENLGVELPAGLSQQSGDLTQRFNQIMFGVATLFRQANDQLGTKKPGKPVGRN